VVVLGATAQQPDERPSCPAFHRIVLFDAWMLSLHHPFLLTCMCHEATFVAHLFGPLQWTLVHVLTTPHNTSDGPSLCSPALRRFVEHVQALKEQDDGFGDEYARIKDRGKQYKAEYPATVGALPCNIKKNRYKVCEATGQDALGLVVTLCSKIGKGVASL